jgi:hypothetical protein
MKEIIKHYYRTLKNKKDNNFTHLKFKGRNIYNMRDFGKEMTFVHRKLKKLFLVPIIMFCEWYFKGKLKIGVDDSYQFRKVKVFDECFEKALINWNTLYRPHAYVEKRDSKIMMVDGATKRLRFIKELYCNVVCNDTAYLEFHNFLMDEVSKGMREVDKDHVLYTSNSVVDNRYFIFTDNIVSGNIELKQVK